MTDLRALLPLVELKAARAQTAYAEALRAEQALAKTIEALAQQDSFEPQTPWEAEAFAKSVRWRLAQKRKLLTQLAKARAASEPLKKAAAREVAREAVLRQLVGTAT